MTDSPPPSASEIPPTDQTPAISIPLLATRGGVGGVLMGLANLVPGISGGTMLLAAGVYPRFIAAIGELTTLRFRRESLIVLGSVVVAALAAIVLLAGPVKELVVHHRWVMYSLFIGLTLGGLPVVWRLVTAEGRRPDVSLWAGAVAGFLGMAALAVFQSAGGASDVHRDGFMFLLIAGIAGASAMILPGVSGGYLLLVLGVYVPILAGVDAFKDGLKGMDIPVVIDVGLKVVLPVGLGVVVGIVGVSNLLRWLLARFELATLGVLLGLLLGAVVGLWPFQQSVAPEEGATVKGREVTAATADDGPEAAEAGYVFVDTREAVEAEDWPTSYFTPSGGHLGGAAGLIVAGVLATLAVDRLGREKPER